jgi:hypothetical protein
MVSSMIEAIRYVESQTLEQENIATIIFHEYFGDLRLSHSYTPWLKEFSEVDDGSLYVKVIYDHFASNSEVKTSMYDLVKFFVELAGDRILMRWMDLKRSSSKTKKVKEQKQAFKNLLRRDNVFRIATSDERLSELILRAGLIDPDKLNEETINVVFGKIAAFEAKKT